MDQIICKERDNQIHIRFLKATILPEDNRVRY